MDVFHPFESAQFHGTYREFARDKRGCFFNTVKSFPKIWQAFELLDEIWDRELKDLYIPGAQERLVSLLLLYDAHLKIRLAFELGFSRCLPEACAILRAGVESVAFSSKVLEDPRFGEIWARKNLGGASDFNRTFVEDKKKKLFTAKHGVNRLYRFWDQYSEFGAHSRARGLAVRISKEEAGPTMNIRFNYLDSDRETLETILCSILMCSCTMEDVFYKAYRARLELDPRVLGMRKRLGDLRRSVSADLLDRYEMPHR